MWILWYALELHMKKLIFPSAHKIVSHDSMEIPSRVPVNEEGGEDTGRAGRRTSKYFTRLACSTHTHVGGASDRV